MRAYSLIPIKRGVLYAFYFFLNMSSVAHEISSVEDPNVGKFKEGPPRKKFQTFCQKGGGGRPREDFFLRVPLSIMLRRCQVLVVRVAGWLTLTLTRHVSCLCYADLPPSLCPVVGLVTAFRAVRRLSTQMLSTPPSHNQN